MNREWKLGGRRGLYFGSLSMALASKVSWYMLKALRDADTEEQSKWMNDTEIEK